MRLPYAPATYNQADQTKTRSLIEQAQEQLVKRGQDIEMGAGRIILQSPDGSRFYLTASDLGVLTLTAA